MEVHTRAAVSATPVFRDGLTHSRNYVILAVKDNADQYNCVCLANYGTFKLYPNLEFWGMTREQINTVGLGDKFYNYEESRAGYVGFHKASTADVKVLMDIIRGQRGVAAVSDEMIVGVFERKEECRASSERQHPPGAWAIKKYPPMLEHSEPLKLAFEPS